MRYLIILTLLCLSIKSIAQTKTIKKWRFDLGSGIAIPLPKYGSIDLERSFLYMDYNNDGEIDALLLDFFDKKDHGAAEVGYSVSGSISRYFLSNILASFNFNYTQNNVNTSQINSYYDNTVRDYYNDPIYDDYHYIFSQNPYKVTLIYLGIGYSFQLDRLNIAFQPHVGQANMTFPIYDLRVPPTIYHAQHRGPTPDLKSLTYGITATFDISPFKNIFISFHSKYLSADFEYSIEPKSVGIDSRLRNDEVNYRVVDLGFSIGIIF